MGLKSTLSSTKAGSPALRTSIPPGIIEFLGLKSGDKIDWGMLNTKDRSVKITKIK
jgi:hypothetical protein